MPWDKLNPSTKKFAPNPMKEKAMELIRQAASDAEVMQQTGISLRTLARYKEEIEHPKPTKPAGLPGSPADAGKVSTAVKTPAGAVETAKVALQGPAPTLFILSGDRVPLSASDLDNAYQYYREIQRMDPEIDDNFGTAVAVAMRHVWRHFKQRLAMEVGFQVMQQEEENDGAVEDGRATG